jgi:hypothetical protein
VSEVVLIDQITGFETEMSSYCNQTIKMDNMELLKAIKKMMAKMKAKQNTNMAKMDTKQDQTK